ncbi:MAG TPA: hypothetical protein PLZ16_04835 [Gammaproteobacteria bacterium]|nr:hypothetical protein [Gammaproteobacteria bacterium]
MNTLQQKMITDQNISQMISSYLLRNRELLFSLRERVVCEPVPLAPKKDIAPLVQNVLQ